MEKNRLRQGYTTGTCAQAATKAAARMLVSGRKDEKVTVILPQGNRLTLEVMDVQMLYEEGAPLPFSVSCAVQKDSGDDPDITNGVLVYSKVSYHEGKGVMIDGGEGIGRITSPGLEQPVGAAAINRVPRQMIEKEVREVMEEAELPKGMAVQISIPGGEELAGRTFNPKLGIRGGLSVLGTSGIVEPMSEQALVDTIRIEMKMKAAQGTEYMIMAPGNYGLEFLRQEYQIEESEIILCSNYIGQAIDIAAELGVKGVLLAGHIGKLVKVAGGIMNTHSKWADCRMEILAAAALRAGLPGEKAREILDCITTDDVLSRCTKEEQKAVTEQMMERLEYYLSARAGDNMSIGAIVYSNVYGILGKTKKAEEILWQGNYMA